MHGDPGGVATLLRAALPSIPVVNQLPGIRKSGDFDGLAFSRPAVTVERPHVTAYAGVCGFPVKDTVPLTYLHVLAFPLHMAILTDPSFPFPAVGAVHLANSITGAPPDAVGETVTRDHPRRRGHAPPEGPDRRRRHQRRRGRARSSGRAPRRTCGAGSRRARRPQTRLRPTPVRGEIPPGRRDLAARRATSGGGTPPVSGDHNPIHLYPLTAKALGFKRQIAHGMWSLARCVAAVENRLPDAVTVDVAFKKPIFLPGSVAFGSTPVDGGYAFSLTRPQDGAPHLAGRTTGL